MKKQTRNMEIQINEEEIGKLPEKEFRIMIVKMIKNLETKKEKMQESINKDLEESKNKHTETNNTITETKNTLEGINSRISEAEERVSKAGLVVLNSLNFCLSEKLFISPSILNEIIARYCNLGCRFFPFNTLNISTLPSGLQFLLKDLLLSVWGFPCMLLVSSPLLLVIFFLCI